MNKRFQKKRNVIIYSLILFLVLSFVFISITSSIRINQNQTEIDQIIQSDQHILSSERSIISNELYNEAADLMFLADIYKAYAYQDGGSEEIKQLWSDFATREISYDQIRFIGADGHEMIRIDNHNGRGVVVDDALLQDKTGRYYFQDTFVLDEGQIYVSKLDLNVENDVVELPIKPMIRLATPIFGLDGERDGIVIVNLSARYMLQYMEEIASSAQGDIYLLNSNGYYIYNSRELDTEWAFMYDGREDESFAAEFPGAWDYMKNTDGGVIWTGDNCFMYKTVVPLGELASYMAVASRYSIVLGEGNWTVVSHIHPGTEVGELFFVSTWDNFWQTAADNIFAILVILVLSVSLAVIIWTRSVSSEKTKYFSEYDIMTGVLNRRAGLELLRRAHRSAAERGEMLSICYADVNGLKEVNDHIGHEAGDELIESVVDVLRRYIRQTDFIIRLGGDEFLIVLRRSGAQAAENVWNRITAEFDRINQTEGRQYLISVSHGIETFEARADEDIDEVVGAADQKMYEEKRHMKKDLSVIRKENRP